MKYFYTLFLLAIGMSVFSQKTYVPDDNFEQALIDLGYDTGPLDDSVPTANIVAITSLNVSGKNISDLTGIEAFTDLVGLFCSSNQLTTLDVSANTELDGLYCSSNQLTSLNISANTNLTGLECGSNQLTSLDLSADTSLTYLNCYNNQLTSLDLSKNKKLDHLDCGTNALPDLDVTLNTKITYLDCSYNQLSGLDVSADTSLTLLFCYNNQITSLDLSNNIHLDYLDCQSNQLDSLDVSLNTELTKLICLANSLTNLDVRNGTNDMITTFSSVNNPDLTCIFVDDKNASFLSNWFIDATSHFVNSEAECDALAPPKTYVPDDNFEQALIDLGYDTAPLDDSVLTVNIEVITTLNISGKNISDLTGIEDFTALQELYCNTNQLTNLDVTQNADLSVLSCNENQLSALDVHSNTELTQLMCGANQLTGLDVSANIKLIQLSCYDNQLPDLDLSSNTALTDLYCNDNQFTNLDVSNNTALTSFDCFGNLLTSLDVSANTDLLVLNCNGNQLSTLDLSTNTNLSGLYCYDNQITELDLSADTNLVNLICENNQLASLDVRNGHNEDFSMFKAKNNPDLTCILVDDKNAAYLSNWEVDATSTFVDSEAECDALDVAKLDGTRDLYIYPNPVRRTFQLSSDQNVTSVKIYDVVGNLIRTFGKQESYGVSDLAEGLYFVKVYTGKKDYTFKIRVE